MMNVELLEILDQYHAYWRRISVALGGLGLLVLVVAGASYMAPPTEPVQTTNTHVTTIDTETKAPVVENTTFFRDGAIVQNSSLYLLDEMPRATITSTVTGPEETHEATVTQTVEVRLSGVREGNPFWQERYAQTSESTTVTGSSPTATTELTLDMQEFRTRAVNLRSEFNHRGKISADVFIKTHYKTDQYTITKTQRLPVSVGDHTYAFGAGSTTSKQSATTSSTTATEPRPLKYAKPLGLLGGLFLVGAVVSLLAGRYADPSRTQREYAHHKYSEWISRGSVTEQDAKTTVTVESLADLVDVAIDTNNRVLYDADEDTYMLVVGDTVYSLSSG